MSAEVDTLLSALKDRREAALTGRAGTGKTTLAREVIERWKGNVVQTAFTGKAARRLSQVTGRPASTIHRGIYMPPSDEGGDGDWQVKPVGGPDTLLVVDEASMVSRDLYLDIKASVAQCAGVLWLGDPNQLPPVDGFVGPQLNNPDVELSVVHRHRGGVLKLADAILDAHEPRDLVKVIMGGVDSPKNYPNVHFLRGPNVPAPALWRAKSYLDRNNRLSFAQGSASALVTRTNEYRMTLNVEVRKLLNLPSDALTDEEPVLVMANHYATGLLNGMVTRNQTLGAYSPQWDPDAPEHLSQHILTDEDGVQRLVYLDPRCFVSDPRVFREGRREDSMAWRHTMQGELRNQKWRDQVESIRRGGYAPKLLGPAGYTVHGHLGYALTAHKAQGSQWSTVGVVWDGWVWAKKNFEEARAWLYTAVTRASENLILWVY